MRRGGGWLGWGLGVPDARGRRRVRITKKSPSMCSSKGFALNKVGVSDQARAIPVIPTSGGSSRRVIVITTPL